MNAVIKEVRNENQATIVTAQGEIDLRHSPGFHQALVNVCERRPKLLLINLGEVTYMDSSGVGTLVEIFRRTKDYGGRMVLISPQERVRSVFEITKLDRFFTIRESESEVLSGEGGGG